MLESLQQGQPRNQPPPMRRQHCGQHVQGQYVRTRNFGTWSVGTVCCCYSAIAVLQKRTILSNVLGVYRGPQCSP
eukprot:9589627-Ditylum_brightwellii.AAC.1